MPDRDGHQSFSPRYWDLIERRQNVLRERQHVVMDLAREYSNGTAFSPSDPSKVDPDKKSQFADRETIEKWNESIEDIRSNEEFQETEEELQDIESKLDDLWEAIQDELIDPEESNKDNIGTLWRVIGEDIPEDRVISIVGTSKSYLQKLRFDKESGTAVLKDHVKRRKQNRASPSKKQKVKERDGNICIRCGSDENLVVHHIIPIDGDGSNDISNLVTLCPNCHREAHGGNTRDSPTYATTPDFWNWIEQS